MTRFASEVYIIHRRNEFRAVKVIQERVFANPKIKVIWDSVIEKIEGEDFAVKKIAVENVRTGEKRSLILTAFLYMSGQGRIQISFR